MSGLETLPPDQRAVLQLILVQGRGYADLAATLRLDAAAVRERAHAGAEALGLPGGASLDPQTRGRVVDYLLGQQDDGERIVTFAELGDSPDACRWAQALREQLAGVTSEQLPEVPAAAAVATNGSSAGTGAATALAAAAPAPPAPPAPTPARPAAPLAQPAAAAPAPAPATSAPTATTPSTPAGGGTPPATPGDGGDPPGPGGPRPSRVGGAILIAGVVALAVVLVIVLTSGGGDGGGSDSASTTPAKTQAQARTQASTNAATTPSGRRQPTARIVAQVNLTAPAGGSAIGVGLVQLASNGRRAIAIEAQRLPANGAQDIYAVWLQGTAGSKFLGFVPRQVRANGSFTVTAPVPTNASSYSTVLVTREGTTAVPTAPGTAILSGPLRLTS